MKISYLNLFLFFYYLIFEFFLCYDIHKSKTAILIGKRFKFYYINNYIFLVTISMFFLLIWKNILMILLINLIIFASKLFQMSPFINNLSIIIFIFFSLAFLVYFLLVYILWYISFLYAFHYLQFSLLKILIAKHYLQTKFLLNKIMKLQSKLLIFKNNSGNNSNMKNINDSEKFCI